MQRATQESKRHSAEQQESTGQRESMGRTRPRSAIKKVGSGVYRKNWIWAARSWAWCIAHPVCPCSVKIDRVKPSVSVVLLLSIRAIATLPPPCPLLHSSLSRSLALSPRSQFVLISRVLFLPRRSSHLSFRFYRFCLRLVLLLVVFVLLIASHPHYCWLLGQSRAMWPSWLHW